MKRVITIFSTFVVFVFSILIYRGWAQSTATTIGANIITTGDIGIGTTSPERDLDVVGTMQVGSSAGAGKLNVYRDTNAGDSTNFVDLQVGNKGSNQGRVALQYQNAAATGSPVGRLAFQPRNNANSDTIDLGNIIMQKTAGADTGFIRFETKNIAGNTAERLRIDPEGNVGIGTSSPTSLLTVAGNVELSASGSIRQRISSTDSNVALQFNPFGNFGDVYAVTSDGADTKTLRLSGGGDVDQSRGALLKLPGNEAAADAGDVVIVAGDGGNFIELLNGNVGVGSTSPGSKLYVAGGDVTVATQGNGVILKATDGASCYRVTVNNAGTLATASVTCP